MSREPEPTPNANSRDCIHSVCLYLLPVEGSMCSNMKSHEERKEDVLYHIATQMTKAHSEVDKTGSCD